MSPRQLPQNTACGGGGLVTHITPRLVGICEISRHKAQVALAAARPVFRRRWPGRVGDIWAQFRNRSLLSLADLICETVKGG